MVQTVRIFTTQEKYEPRLDQPALLKGLAKTWPGFTKWTPQYFRERFGGCQTSISHYQTQPGQKPRDKYKATIAEYLDVLEGAAAPTYRLNQDSYIAGWQFLKNAPELTEDIQIPEPFRDNLLERIDREIINYDYMSLFIGHSRAETPLHTDSFAVCVWLANLVGRKTIRILPPVDYKNIRNAMDAFDPETVARWTAMGIPVFEAVLEAGDVFVIPPGYWHQVKNEGFTVAVSVNYMSPFHFLTFEQQLRAKLLAPYVKLLKLKREVIGSGELDHSADCLKHFDFLNNESKFLDYLGAELQQEREVLELARSLAGA